MPLDLYRVDDYKRQNILVSFSLPKEVLLCLEETYNILIDEYGTNRVSSLDMQKLIFCCESYSKSLPHRKKDGIQGLILIFKEIILNDSAFILEGD